MSTEKTRSFFIYPIIIPSHLKIYNTFSNTDELLVENLKCKLFALK